MSTNERERVALFIDWDNLAISTAADLGGATPDIKAIVQRAQQYGTVIIAKAYAEWSATSDRLAVYRAGIEPVYAPTFRFEPDTATQQGKGKSLADPCMVADCVDSLHLFHDIGTYVIVTGDKDMIPVVRLAQLRGRRVVVIGPDYVAGVLREMADEFISYRSLVETAPARPLPELPPRRYGAPHGPATEEPVHRRGGDRRHVVPLARQERLAPPPPVARPKPTAEPVEAPPEAPAEARPQADDLRSVFNVIVDILRQRHEEGRDRVRATNLKDALMQRMPGFSERRFGFAKFKDLLTAAEKAGLVRVTVAGPVHWILLPGVAEPEETKPTAVLPAVAPPAVEAAAAPAPEQQLPVEAPPAPVEERRNEMIRFIHQLGERSRWLTYTYVLTNLISHFGKTMRQPQAEAQARATLNDLVQLGVLRVDKEPQEVEVGGAKHRVRMCHLNTDHELVTEALRLATEERLSAAEQVETAGAAAPEAPAEEPAPPALAPATGEPTSPAAPSPPEAAAEPAETLAGGNGALSLGGAPIGEEHAVIVQPVGVTAPDTGETTPELAEREAEEPPLPWPAVTEAGAEAPELPPSPVVPSAEGVAEPVALPAPATEALAQPGLEQAYAALEQVVFDATSAEKPALSASTLRGRLVHALGSFNERQLGFPRFKDFLLAAQRAGIIRVESRGYQTWVSLPERRPAEEPAGAAEGDETD